jgi:hypothetical protein
MLHTRILFSICIGLVLLPVVSFAQTVHQVSPRAIERTVQPGDIFNATITITNPFAYRLAVYPSVHGLETSRTGSTSIERILPAEETTFTSWVTMSRAGQRIDPGGSATVDVAFKIPRTIEAGTYTGLLGFGSGIARHVAERAVEEGGAPGVVLSFTVPERDIDTEGAASVIVSDVIFDETQTAISYTIQNPGTKEVVPAGELIITNQRGAEVAALPVNPEAATIAPGEVLSLAIPAPELPMVGKYQVNARFNYQTEQLASILMSDTFWYLPWPVVAALFLVLLLMSVLLYRFLGRQLGSGHVGSDNVIQLPLHMYSGESPPEKHDINLKQ